MLKSFIAVEIVAQPTVSVALICQGEHQNKICEKEREKNYKSTDLPFFKTVI
jgi:hypothetical protein